MLQTSMVSCVCCCRAGVQAHPGFSDRPSSARRRQGSGSIDRGKRCLYVVCDESNVDDASDTQSNAMYVAPNPRKNHYNAAYGPARRPRHTPSASSIDCVVWGSQSAVSPARANQPNSCFPLAACRLRSITAARRSSWRATHETEHTHNISCLVLLGSAFDRSLFVCFLYVSLVCLPVAFP